MASNARARASSASGAYNCTSLSDAMAPKWNLKSRTRLESFFQSHHDNACGQRFDAGAARAADAPAAALPIDFQFRICAPAGAEVFADFYARGVGAKCRQARVGAVEAADDQPFRKRRIVVKIRCALGVVAQARRDAPSVRDTLFPRAFERAGAYAPGVAVAAIACAQCCVERIEVMV